MALAVLVAAVTPVRAAPDAPGFTVNSSADAVDANPGDGTCETGAGNGICTLRAAVMEANTTSDATITVPAGTYTLVMTTSGALSVGSRMSLQGAGAAATIIQGGPDWNDRLMHIHGSGPVDLRALTLRGGNSSGGGGGAYVTDGASLNLDSVVVRDNTAISGGGIDALGTLTIVNSSIVSNTATWDGGGILSYVSGTLTIIDSLVAYNTLSITLSSTGGGVYARGAFKAQNARIAYNTSTSGGGLYLGYGSVSWLTDTVVTDNWSGEGSGAGILVTAARLHAARLTVQRNRVTGSNDGGGISASSAAVSIVDSAILSNTALSGAGLTASGQLTLVNSTVSGNAAAYSGGGLRVYDKASLFNASVISNTSGISASAYGGGIYADGTFTVTDSIIADNRNASGSGSGNDCGGAAVSAGYNVLGSATGCAWAAGTGDVIGVNAWVGPLGDNGGPTLTHVPLPGSPAIDAGNPAGCSSPDGPALSADQRGKPRPIGARCDAGAVEAGLKLFLPSVLRVSPAGW